MYDLNEPSMGSYGPEVIASDAHRHRVEICGVKCSSKMTRTLLT